jgi:DNA polymerase bacteriophage-type
VNFRAQCFLDTETRSRTPIQRGNDLYTRDAQCMIVTWAVGERPARGWDLFDDPAMPAELEDAIDDERVQLIAHNASFDRAILHRCLKKPTPIERWFCTFACACSHGLPGSLEVLCLVLGLPVDQQKLVEDGKLIQFFCVPKADGTFRSPYDFPEKWATFFNYAIRDTEALRACYHKLAKHNYS